MCSSCETYGIPSRSHRSRSLQEHKASLSNTSASSSRNFLPHLPARHACLSRKRCLGLAVALRHLAVMARHMAAHVRHRAAPSRHTLKAHQGKGPSRSSPDLFCPPLSCGASGRRLCLQVLHCKKVAYIWKPQAGWKCCKGIIPIFLRRNSERILSRG